MTCNPDHDAFAAPIPDQRPSLHDSWRATCARLAAEDAAQARQEAATDALGRLLRHDGWTPERQRGFLAAIADGLTVERACACVGMGVSSAYAFRRRASGAGFALGWRAATLLSRDAVADELMTRAMEGITDTVTKPDGSTWTRHRHDNRTALALLNRLDRMCEQAPADPAAAASAHAARLVAQDWEAYLDLLAADRGPADAGLFLARRTGLGTGPAGAPAPVPALEPVLALARADAFVRTGASLPVEIDTHDLDLTERASWTGEQWRRAEAAGLLRVAPAPEEEHETAPLPPLVDDEPVYWDEDAREYRTHLPPRDDEAAPIEWGDFGDPAYERLLTDREQAMMDRLDAIDTAERRATLAAEREAWFAAVEADIAVAGAEAEAGAEAGAEAEAGARDWEGAGVPQDGERADAGLDPASSDGA